MASRRRLAALAATITLTAVGCDGDDDSAADSTATTTVPASYPDRVEVWNSPRPGDRPASWT